MNRLTCGCYSIPRVNETRRDRGVSVMSVLKATSDPFKGIWLIASRAGARTGGVIPPTKSTERGESILENLESNGRKPVIVFVVGRQRVGKTVFLNVLAQYAREHGADFEIWDADISNASNNLSALHPGAKSPPSSDPEQAKAWLERQINHLMEDRVDVMVDVGGGETALTRVIAELPLADSLEEQGIRVVVVHMVGPDAADLDYLDRFEDGGLFAAPATLIVQNAGLVMTPGSTRLSPRSTTTGRLGACGSAAGSWCKCRG